VYTVQYGDGGEQANHDNLNSWEFGAHPIVGTVCTNDTDVNVRTFPLKYVNVTVSGCDCVAIEDSGCQIPLVSNRLFSELCNETVGNLTLHGFGRGQTVQAPLANVTVCLSDVDCENVCELPIMCALTDFCSQDYDVILPAAVLCNLQAKAVVSKGLCNGPTVRACRKGQLRVNSTTADRLFSGTRMGTAVGSRPRSSHANSKPKRNSGCGMSRGAYAVTMLCILCVALIVCIALCFMTDNHDVMFARVLPPAPVMLSCLLPSQRFGDDKIAHLETDQRQQLRQLLDEFAEQFDGRSGRCDAVVHHIQTTDGLMRRQMRPCRASDEFPVSRPMRPSNSLMASPIVCVAKKDGDVCVASDYGYLNSDTVGHAYLMPNNDEVLRNIGKRHIV